MTSKPATTLATTLVAMLALAAAIAGCGDSGDEPTPGGNFGSFFGVVPQGEQSEPDYPRMAAGGVGSYHLLLSWSTVETSEGSYDWSAYDAVIGELARNGIQPVPFVYGTPLVYADAPADPPTTSAEAFAAWADFLRAAAERYSTDGEFWQGFAESDPGVEPRPVRVWEIWNEPNSSVFWTPRPDPDDYASLLTRSARVLRDVDPEAEVMTAGMFATPQSGGAIDSYDFIEAIYAQPGVAEATDIVAVHPYGPDVESVIEQMDRTREVVDEVGDESASTWVTELGWGSEPGADADLAKTPEQQAELLTASFEQLYDGREEWDLRGVMWFTWHDSPVSVGPCNWCQTAGLVDADRDSKPAWLAFTDFTGGVP